LCCVVFLYMLSVQAIVHQAATHSALTAFMACTIHQQE